jgi:RNA recognition motif-containing protein
MQDVKTLWMGDLEPHMDDLYIRKLYQSFGEQVVSVKMIKDKTTGQNSGYCFVEFGSHAIALRVMNALNGEEIPKTNRYFKLNWSAVGSGPASMPVSFKTDNGTAAEYSVFVGDLAMDVRDHQLLQVFQKKYVSVRSAKVVMDPGTNQSKQYGFVKFGDEREQQRAMMEMQGVICGGRPIRVSAATQKYRSSYNSIQLATPTLVSSAYVPPVYTGYAEPDATVYVGNTASTTTEDDIRNFFAGYGDIVSIKIPQGRGCAFIQFVYRSSAEMAINNMNGFLLNGTRVKLSWGKGIAPTTPTSMIRPSPVSTQDYYAYPQAQYPPAQVQQFMHATSASSLTTSNVSSPSLPSPSYPVAKKMIDPNQPESTEASNEKFLNDAFLRFSCETWSSFNF